ncbi:hypothetical protein V2J09_005057 [Rumex salicifolius]
MILYPMELVQAWLPV